MSDMNTLSTSTPYKNPIRIFTAVTFKFFKFNITERYNFLIHFFLINSFITFNQISKANSKIQVIYKITSNNIIFLNLYLKVSQMKLFIL